MPTWRLSLRQGPGDPETGVAQPDTGVRWSCVHAGILEYIPYFWSGPTAQTVQAGGTIVDPGLGVTSE